MRRYFAASVFFILVGTAITRAQEGDLILKGAKLKSIPVEIKDETAAGVVVGKTTFPSDDIHDVVYRVKPIEVQINAYRPAVTADDAAMKGLTNAKLPDAKKIALLSEAIGKYQDADVKLAAIKGADLNAARFARRHCKYKVAFFTWKQAELDPKSYGLKAIERFKAFKESYPSSWQVGRTLQALANLQLENNLFADAEKTFAELAVAEVPEAVRTEAFLMAARVSIRAGKHQEALLKLNKIIDGLKGEKGNPIAIRARVLQAECLLADKGSSEKGRAVLRDIIRDSSDKGVKAAAYNTLGMSYYSAGLLKEARWEFLWVDVVFNQDKNEHAKALYYLWKTFKDLNELERAQECLESLLNDPQFANSEFRAIAQRESKAS